MLLYKIILNKNLFTFFSLASMVFPCRDITKNTMNPHTGKQYGFIVFYYISTDYLRKTFFITDGSFPPDNFRT